MLTELDILKDVTSKFDKLNIDYMLTGSLAMSYYAQPRMTRDIDLVVHINTAIIGKMEKLFASEYYLSIDSVKDAVANEFIFNLIHNESSIKVDCIVRKNQEFRIVEFERREKIKIKDFDIYIVSKEDLIISKLIWFKESNSDTQKKDIKNLLNTGYDEIYLSGWIHRLNLEKYYQELKNE